MRWLISFFLLLGLALISGYIFAKGYPYRLYSRWIEGKDWNRYYTIQGYNKILLNPVEIEEVPPYKEDYSQLWKPFPLQNANIPLPVRHPLFQTIPIVEATSKKSAPQLGIIILAPNQRELSRLYTLPTRFNPDYSQGQELFKLPFVRNRILKIPLEELWKDIFRHKIEVKSKSVDEMIYDLYILHLRSKIFPSGTFRYGLFQEDKAIVEIASRDLDYIVEIIMNYDRGNIYSYILKTEKNKDESLKLRSKFLESITFTPSDPAMAKFLYTEFKQLNFARQVDQEGMLFLFSAWSQEMGRVELLKEMIFYLERGRNNLAQLRPLYRFSLNNYGKTFTTKKLLTEHDDPNLELQRKIEIENIDKARDAARALANPVTPELTPDEKMNIYLKKAKETGESEKSDMTIH